LLVFSASEQLDFGQTILFKVTNLNCIFGLNSQAFVFAMTVLAAFVSAQFNRFAPGGGFIGGNRGLGVGRPFNNGFAGTGGFRTSNGFGGNRGFSSGFNNGFNGRRFG
jgi:hypothetical protein